MEIQNDLIKANIVADSINKQGDRLTSMLLTFPRCVLAEFNTHRILSKNSASSRAIPLKKMIRLVEEHPFVPTRWMKEHKGMQGSEYHKDPLIIGDCIKIWLDLRDEAVKKAKLLSEKDVTKQFCNRLLEPYLMHTVLVTGSEWQNFFALRAHPDTEIHLQELAYKMLKIYNDSKPKYLQAGEWHLPFGANIDKERLYSQIEHDLGIYDPVIDETNDGTSYKKLIDQYRIKIATARCARTSYLNNLGKDDYEADCKLHDQLLVNEPIHASPAEHCAQAMEDNEYMLYKKQWVNEDKQTICEHGWSRNFRGFKQYRTQLKNDTAIDSRVHKKDRSL
jgi:hypothetical protein